MLVALIVASASGQVYPLDGNGVAQVMAASRATLVKFVNGKPDELSSLSSLWAKLDTDFTGSGLVFASVDCAVHPAACEARKVVPAEMTAPVIKLWMPDVGFRRYAGKADQEYLRAYLGKKLREMPEARQQEHAQQFAAEQQRAIEQQRATQGAAPAQQQQQQPDATRRSAGRPRDRREESHQFFAAMVFIAQSLVIATTCAAMFYLYLRRPFAEAPTDLLLVSIGSSSALAVAIVRADAPSGHLTPVARIPMGEVHSLAPLCVCGGSGTKTLVMHAGAPAEVKGDDKGDDKGRAQKKDAGAFSPSATAVSARPSAAPLNWPFESPL